MSTAVLEGNEYSLHLEKDFISIRISNVDESESTRLTDEVLKTIADTGIRKVLVDSSRRTEPARMELVNFRRLMQEIEKIAFYNTDMQIVNLANAAFMYMRDYNAAAFPDKEQAIRFLCS